MCAKDHGATVSVPALAVGGSSVRTTVVSSRVSARSTGCSPATCSQGEGLLGARRSWRWPFSRARSGSKPSGARNASRPPGIGCARAWPDTNWRPCRRSSGRTPWEPFRPGATLRSASSPAVRRGDLSAVEASAGGSRPEQRGSEAATSEAGTESSSLCVIEESLWQQP